ncbi:MazG nucleotide pyrophosphohydrolase domain-containing protein [Nocardioides sp.]|uniref:MazG nucleotide pyrophosphohydrolase domain-containing protein n=1 Tax=Nocardioides sp. TaxID=35761 RepID=UPI003567D72C
MTEPASGEPLVDFLGDMRRMRAECDWKRGQTHRSLARYLLEEVHETLEVLDAWDERPDPAHLCEELGDLLLQVYFHAVIAEESGDFTLDDVARGIITKMHRRNPHVFGDEGAAGADTRGATEINEQWQAIKAAEKPRTSPDDGLPPGLPALLLADKVLDRRERATGRPDRPDRPTGDDLGDRLLALVAEARSTGVDPEQALRDAVRRLVEQAP